MNSRQFSPHSGRTECNTTQWLSYRLMHPAEAEGPFVIDAVLKVHDGIRHFYGPWPERPSDERMVLLCLRFGEFSARPYSAGQAADESTHVCVLALFYDLCRRKGLDATALMVQAYPGNETTDRWSDVTWRQYLDAADWQRTIFPTTWTEDAVIGLLMSLNGQQRQPLGTRLEQEMQARAVLPLPSGEGEP
jgi:hypothetical protein